MLVVAVLEELSDAVTPPGNPEQDRLTLLLNPARGKTERMAAAFPPGVMVMPTGEAYSVKSFVPVPERKLIVLIPFGVGGAPYDR